MIGISQVLGQSFHHERHRPQAAGSRAVKVVRQAQAACSMLVMVMAASSKGTGAPCVHVAVAVAVGVHLLALWQVQQWLNPGG